MKPNLLVLLLIQVNYILSATIDKCPKQCECELQSDQTVAVYCNRGGVNDTVFYRILEFVPEHASLLKISAPIHRPNSFRWNDNLNRFGQLRTLILENCEIPALSQSIWMPNLKKLDLRHNQIDSIQINSFKGLSSLESLNLGHNRLTVLPSGAFIFLKRLKQLSIVHNNFNELPSSFLRGLANLQELELDGNYIQIGQINNLFSDVPNLQRLELNFCSLDDQTVTQLQFDKIPLIRRLGLAGNNLSDVPSASFRALAHLQTIDLRYNEITRLQPCAFCSCNITEIFLGHNLLGVKPNSINVEAFAEVFAKKIDLSYNHFEDFESKLLGYAEASVEELDLSGNALPSLNPVYTQNMPSLTRLHVADNKFGQLSPIPSEYDQLVFLNLSHNQLSQLPEDIHHYLGSLKSLDISHNQFVSIPDTQVKSFIAQMDKVFLSHNQWDCRCAVQNLQAFMLEKYAYRNELQYDETLCDKPELLKNQPLHRVQHINDCAIFFGASYGLTQASELFILLGIILTSATLITIFVILFLYCGHNRKQKNGYTANRNGVSSKTKLTHAEDTANFIHSGNAELVGSSMNSSMLSEPLTHSGSISSSHDLPPPLPKTSPFLLF